MKKLTKNVANVANVELYSCESSSYRSSNRSSNPGVYLTPEAVEFTVNENTDGDNIFFWPSFSDVQGQYANLEAYESCEAENVRNWKNLAKDKGYEFIKVYRSRNQSSTYWIY